MNARFVHSRMIGVLGCVLTAVCCRVAVGHEGSGAASPGAISENDDSFFIVATPEEMRAFHDAHPATLRPKSKFHPVYPPPRALDLSKLGKIPVRAARPVGPAVVQPHEGEAPLAPPAIASFAGQADNNTTVPPDTTGAVGPSNVYEFLNIGRTIFNKTGGVTSALVGFQAFWSSLGTGAGQPAQAVSDPRVLWDQYAGRWIVSAIGTGTNQFVLVGISQTADPAGLYNLYGIRVNLNTNGFAHSTHKVDFDITGYDPNNIIVTVNIFNSALTAFIHADAYVFEKAKLIAGGALVYNTDFTIFHNPCGAVVGANITFTPCVTYGQTSGTAVNYLLDNGWYDTVDLTQRFFRVSTISGTGATATLDCTAGSGMADSNFVASTGCYNFNMLDASQSGCATLIETNDTRISSPGIVRNGMIWFTHAGGAPTSPCADPATSPAATRAEVWWYQVDPAHVFMPGLPEQYSSVTDANRAYYFPSIAVNSADAVLLAFSGSSTTENAGSYYTARGGCDPPNTMQAVSLMKAGEDTYRKTFGGGRNRWGDYSATCVDPVDDLTLWTLQEYARPESGGACPTDNTGRWGTWWGSVKPCPKIAVAPASLPGGTIGTPYLQTLVGSGGSSPYAFALASGSLPPSLSLLPNGDITGTPDNQVGVFNFSVTVTDNDGCVCTTLNYSITTVCAAPGDVNLDTSKDGLDIQHFANCYQVGTSPGGYCGCADMDGDGDVDDTDVGLFAAVLLL